MNKEQILNRILELKKGSGSHSPSIETLLREIPEIKMDVDACFLSNPYATELFMKYLHKDLIQSNKLKDVLEYYPPQNGDISKYIESAIGISKEKIFVGNGAIEIIQAVIHNFVSGKLCIILPTFSSYYEFANDKTEVLYYALSKEDDFKINVEDLIQFVKSNKINNLVIINPNNPNGGYIQIDELKLMFNELRDLDNLIIDESFLHFAYEGIDLFQVTNDELIENYKNIILIKSMSKDFGIAGIRAGYAVMPPEKKNQLIKTGYLWNSNGLSNYFFQLYSKQSFQEEYEVVRKKYIMNTLMFISELNAIKGIKAYPSKANFVLVEVLCGLSSFEFAMELLLDYGIYVRDCSDKIGLKGQFCRIASRTFEENLKTIAAVKEITRAY